jgi:hypothetical protein
MEINPKALKSTALLLFSIVFSPLFSNIQAKEINPVIFLEEAKNLYLAGNYNLSLHKVGSSLLALENNKTLPRYNEYLAEAYFIYGLCFLKRNNAGVAQVAFRKVLEHDSQFRVDESLYGPDIVGSFYELSKAQLPQEKTSEQHKTIEAKSAITEEESAKEDKDARPFQVREKNSEAPIKVTQETIRVRIIDEEAVLRLAANDKSKIIRSLPLGAIFNIKELSDEWIKIKLPPDKDGIIITGYVRSSFVELESQTIRK